MRSVWCLLGVLSLAAACAPQPARTKVTAPGTPGASAVPHALVVDFRDGTPAEVVAERARQWGLSLRLNSVEGVRSGIAIAEEVDDVDAALTRIRREADVEEAEPLVRMEALAFTPNDPEFPKQWNLRMLHMPEAWERSRGKGVVVAVIDTGIAYEDRGDFVQVPDLAGAHFAAGYDFVHDTEHPNDDNGHGTHVAGTIAQRTNNGVGVAGVAFEARLMPLKVLDRAGIGNSADIADAIRWAVDHGAKVLNLSLGGPGYSAVMERAVAYARTKGAVVVCAAGNAGTGQVSYPAAYAGAVAVGAVGPDGQLAPYSSWGEALDLIAPGGNTRLGPGNGILQATIDRTDFRKPVLAEYQGTSMATPHVAGVAALLFAAGARTPDEVEKALFQGAASEAGAWTPRAGHGRLDALGALEALGKAGLPVDWAPLIWSAALLALLLLSLRVKVRPGFLNVLLNPATLLPLLLSTVGLWFLKLLWQRFVGHPPAAAEVLSLPIPDWERILFGRGRLASPLMYSALLPGIAALVALRWRALRPVVAGLSLGFAGFLLYAAWAKAPGIAYLPFTFLARPWLVLNGVLAALLCRSMLRREAGR
ncbi:MAG TPA: S8 family peptidase [Myxococcaceae bacterium]|nr:S8 family peptidase [Myxococcaceae bacterium]